MSVPEGPLQTDCEHAYLAVELVFFVGHLFHFLNSSIK